MRSREANPVSNEDLRVQDKLLGKESIVYSSTSFLHLESGCYSLFIFSVSKA